MRRRLQQHHRARTFAVSLLILALLPTPLPRVEFHNVRHHDAPGQVCEYHDHLLRWHPDARGAADVPILHWHWAWPEPDAGPADSGHDGVGPRLHAHLADEVAADARTTPAVVADAPPRAPVPPLGILDALAFALPGHIPPRIDVGSPPGLPFSATYAPRTSLTDRLVRWSC